MHRVLYIQRIDTSYRFDNRESLIAMFLRYICTEMERIRKNLIQEAIILGDAKWKSSNAAEFTRLDLTMLPCVFKSVDSFPYLGKSECVTSHTLVYEAYLCLCYLTLFHIKNQILPLINLNSL